MRFTFGPNKDATNIVKRGLTLANVRMVFDAPEKLTLTSPQGNEPRLMDVAMVEVAGVALVLIYVLREPAEVRAASLRRASRTERNLYANWQETH